ILIEARGQKYIDVDLTESLDWAPVSERVKTGIRNSNIMAIAPTATIANITGASQSSEPTYQNLYVKPNLSGEFSETNPYQLRDRLRSGNPLDCRRRQPPPEVDRPGAVAEPLHRRRQRQEARRDLPHGLVPWPENHLLPPCPGRDQHREVHRQHRQAQRRVQR